MKPEDYKVKSFDHIYYSNRKSPIRRWFFGLLILLIVILLLPWTQNIRARGLVTTVRQEQRPQQLNTIIPGRVVEWRVKEGDFVTKGDTLLQLAEIKDNYLDPELIERTEQQLDAKKNSVSFYENKASTARQQVGALQNERDLKLEQINNKIDQQQRKIESEELDLQAATNELQVANRQLGAAQAMLDSGVISLVDFEKRKVQFQNAAAKKTNAQNVFDNARQEMTILRIEKQSVLQQYTEKISKVEGDRFQSLSEIANSNSEIAKLQNQYANYQIRNGLYFITAPQSGQVTKAMKAGIGEIVKEGEMLLEIVPDSPEYAVELFIRPVDLPLVSKGQKVRFWFDGYPAIVFSGWPNASYGTFGGVVIAVENSASANGNFRILVARDPEGREWPPTLKLGTGAQGMALLKDVPIWYELWRNINGFPPDFYQPKTGSDPKTKK